MLSLKIFWDMQTSNFRNVWLFLENNSLLCGVKAIFLWYNVSTLFTTRYINHGKLHYLIQLLFFLSNQFSIDAIIFSK